MTRAEQQHRGQAMAEMYRDRPDLKIREIAKHFGVTPSAIAFARKRFGVPDRHPYMAEVMKAIRR